MTYQRRQRGEMAASDETSTNISGERKTGISISESEGSASIAGRK